MTVACLAGLSCAELVGYHTLSAEAADLTAVECCVDLENRLAELEATAARAGQRRVSLSIAGQVNKALLMWDDGTQSDTAIVGNKNNQSHVAFTGESRISPDTSVGYELTIRVRDDLSDEIDQRHDNGGPEAFQVWQSHGWVEHRALGKLTVGLASRVSDGAPESDLSEAGVAGYAGVQDVGGGFAVRLQDGTAIPIAWGDLYSHFNGDTANIIRYDTPIVAGFVASVSWGEDDIWDAGVRFEGEAAGFQVSASAAFTDVSDTDGGFADDQHSIVVGSAAILHQASGLNALVSFGNRHFKDAVEDVDGVSRTPADSRFIYGKVGWLAQLTEAGPTAFYAEYGRFSDFVSVGGDADALLALDPSGRGRRYVGNTARVWGVGVVQHVEAAALEVYVGYRHHDVDFDVVDDAAQPIPVPGADPFHTIIMGSKIAF